MPDQTLHRCAPALITARLLSSPPPPSPNPQTYASATVKFTFELGGNCVTADYAATSARWFYRPFADS